MVKGILQKIKNHALFIREHVVKRRSLALKILLAFLISDLLLLESYTRLLPPKKLPRKKASLDMFIKPQKTYSMIFEKNIFHQGDIPMKLLAHGEDASAPVQSSLPFVLQGTIVHSQMGRSVASIRTDKSRSYKVDDKIQNQARITKIQRRRVTFFNENNNQLEYIEIPEEADKISFLSPKKATPSLGKKIKKVVTRIKNQFTAQRSDINRYLQKLPEVLRTARVVPHSKGRGGQVDGFRFASIKKESIFSDLGFQVGDVIKRVDGETVNNPEKALALFEKLKDSSAFKIVVEREGKDMEYEYNVSEDAPIN